jgi:hypothetical protein
MPTNTATLKTFAQQTRAKLISLITTKLQFVLGQDTAELRGHEKEIDILRKEIQSKGEKNVIEEVAYTWFNRVMALRYMDANGYDTPMIVSPATGQTRPEILQDAMGGTFDEELHLSNEDKLLPESKLYRKLLVAICNQKYAEMPFLFERISDYTELLLPDDLLSDQSFVSDIRNGMTDEDCQNVELLGWLYQFYITDRKADAEIKKTKKGGLKSDEQAAATQLFTPHWVVRYMVENSLGRIWMTLHPDSPLIKDMPYYIPTPEGQTDVIPEDIKSVEDIRFIDPCMGSGHILVYAFDLFTKMYEEEGYQTRDIPTLILTNNIFGIDIDRRCYQLASFALSMKARAYYSRYLRKAIQPNTIVLQNIDHDTIASAGDWDAKSSMWQFENVDTIGSLLQISSDDCVKIQVESGLFGEQQQLLKMQAEYLSSKYHCVVTNPPYLGKGMGEALTNYAKSHYVESKTDTMVMFMERCLDFAKETGYLALINFQSWMFVSNYSDYRKTLVAKTQIYSMLHFGRGIFGADFGSVSFVLQKHVPSLLGSYYQLFEKMSLVRTPEQIEQLYLTKPQPDYFVNQANFLLIPGNNISYWVSQQMLQAFKNGVSLGEYGTTRKGMYTGLNDKFVRNWSEVSFNNILFNANSEISEFSNEIWYPYANGGYYKKWFGNYEDVVYWQHNGNRLRTEKNSQGKIRAGCFNLDYIFNIGLIWNSITISDTSMRIMCSGSLFSSAANAWFGKNVQYVLACLNSKVSRVLLKAINPTVNANPGDIGKIPLIIHQSTYNRVEETCNRCIELSKYDWDTHETSWDFQTNELLTIDESNWQNILNDYSVQAGICIDPAPANIASLEWRISMYKMKWETKFRQLHTNEEELNRQFIEIYGLQDELTPDVPLSEITILQKGEISIENNEIVWHENIIIKQLISYLVGCFMGRYSIDKPGLIIASQHQDLNTLGLKVEGIDNNAPGRLAIDDDGIVPVIEEEDFFADDMTQRIEQAIKMIFGDTNYHENIKYINEKLGKPVREYLFKDFFADHIDGKMYQKRPIYWLFSSKMGEKKKKGYFKALVYMHRMEPDTLSKLHADYVRPYLNKIERQLTEAEDQTTRDDLTQAQRNKALKSVEELRDKVREVHAFEQQLVEMASHRISIDLDDGVKANYPKYYPLVEPIKGLESSDE